MMSKTETMPAMIAWRIDPMPLTIAIKQAPIDWKTARICLNERFLLVSFFWFLEIFIFREKEMVVKLSMIKVLICSLEAMRRSFSLWKCILLLNEKEERENGDGGRRTYA